MSLREREEVQALLREESAMSEIKEGICRHYEGNLYRVIRMAKHAETLEETVVYQDVNEERKYWARPVSMRNEEE